MKSQQCAFRNAAFSNVIANEIGTQLKSGPLSISSDFVFKLFAVTAAL